MALAANFLRAVFRPSVRLEAARALGTPLAQAPAEGAQPLRGVVRWSRPALGDGSSDMVNINPPRAISGQAFR